MAPRPPAITRSDDPPSPAGAGPPARGASALRQSDQQLEFALHAGRMGSWELDIVAQRFTTSQYCRVVFGLGPDDPFERVEDLEALIHPEDRPRRQAAIDEAIATGGEMELEYRTFRPDGTVGWVLARGRAAYEDGQAVLMAGISMDVTQRKRAEARQNLLINELNHRVKNTLASVQSLAMLSWQGDQPAAEAFLQRLHALARVHDLLSEAAWEGAALGDVVRRTLAPYEDAQPRLTIAGPAVRLNPNAAVTLSMAFHELATNAIKYGALSVPTGRIEILWRAQDGAVTIDWRESAGPAVAEPTHHGFGSRLIEQGLARELDGHAAFDFRPEGLVCSIRLPLSAKLSLAPE
jgi:two-component sensor histidine kinase